MELQQELGKTTILIETETRESLRKLGSKGETYDSIIQRLMEYWNSGHDVKVALS
jgi:hypothetical protein